jgi:hypothetical protein
MYDLLILVSDTVPTRGNPYGHKDLGGFVIGAIVFGAVLWAFLSKTNPPPNPKDKRKKKR